MNDAWKEMIQTNIYEYISKIDYNSSDFSLAGFKSDLKKIIGMEPAVKIKWNVSEKINELKKAAGVEDYKTIIEKAEQIEIFFTEINDSDKQIPISLKFLL